MCLKFFYPKTTSLPQLPEAAAPSANLSQIIHTDPRTDATLASLHITGCATVLVAMWRRLALQFCAGDAAAQLLHSEVHNDIRADMRLRACRCGCSRGERDDTLC